MQTVTLLIITGIAARYFAKEEFGLWAILMPFISHRVFNWRPVIIDDSWGLNTIPKGTLYSICNTLCCGDCGLIFLDLRFSDSEMTKAKNVIQLN